MPFTIEEYLNVDLRGAKPYSWSAQTGIADENDLKTDLQIKLPELYLEDLKTDIRAGRSYSWQAWTNTKDSWDLKAELKATQPYEWTAWTNVPDPWDLHCHLEAKKQYQFSFTTTFAPTKRRTGATRAELFRQGNPLQEIFAIPLNWYQKDSDRTFSTDLWFARYQDDLQVDDIRLSAFALGADNRLGQEIIANGYLSAKKTADSTYTALGTSTYLSLGVSKPHTSVGVDFKLNVPQGASTTGLVMFGLKIEMIRSVRYGGYTFGERMYGSHAVSKPETILIKLHITG